MIGRFFHYVEIRTKITSVFAFFMTTAYIFYMQKSVNWHPTIIFFVSMFTFDLVTTAINNYIDTKTNHQTLEFSRKNALMIIYVLIGVSAGLGLYLVYLTDAVVFLAGVLCFICGILYTYGPVPISRQPLGEILSGIFYGFFIPFILLYINLPGGTLVSFDLTFETIKIELSVVPVLKVILLSIVPICVTANIMLANNICDLEKDIAQKRYTLPYYLGDKALGLFSAIYYLAYVDIIFMVVLKVISPLCLISLLTVYNVRKNTAAFLKVQDKETTFSSAIKNYIIIMGSITLMIFLSGLFNIF